MRGQEHRRRASRVANEPATKKPPRPSSVARTDPSPLPLFERTRFLVLFSLQEKWIVVGVNSDDGNVSVIYGDMYADETFARTTKNRLEMEEKTLASSLRVWKKVECSFTRFERRRAAPSFGGEESRKEREEVGMEWFFQAITLR